MHHYCHSHQPSQFPFNVNFFPEKLLFQLNATYLQIGQRILRHLKTQHNLFLFIAKEKSIIYFVIHH